MKKILSLIMALIMCLSLCACGDKKATDATEAATISDVLAEEDVVGTWQWITPGEQGPANGVTHLELYEGGTGKGTNSSMTGGSYYPVTWEIRDGVINISASNTPTVGMKFEDGKLIAVDRSFTYTRVEN